MDGRKGRLKLRRSMRRPQTGTYRSSNNDNDSESEEVTAIDKSDGRNREGLRSRIGAGTSKPDSFGNFGSSKRLGSSRHFEWSLQSEQVVRQLGRLFWDQEEGSGSGGGDGGGLMNADVTLVSKEGDLIQAHKVVLILCCPYFRKLFAKLSKSVAKENTVVVLGNVETTTLNHLIRFIYTGKVDVPTEEESEFLKAGEFLGISGIHSVGQSSGGGGQRGLRGDTHGDEKVIKVHVIDNRSASDHEEQVPISGRQSGKKSPISSTSIRCKEEPVDDDGPSNFGEDFGDSFDDDFGGGGNAYQDDDQGSNFSDLIRRSGSNVSRQSEGDDTDQTFKKQGVPQRYRGLWTKIDPVPPEDLAENWRLKGHNTGVDGYEAWTFYCYHGGERRCGARIKRVFQDGETTFYTNNVQHTNHREGTHGLQHETKIFVRSMLEQGIRKPEKIFSAMKLLSMDLPPRAQLLNYIRYTVRKHRGELQFPTKNPSGRVRKRAYTPTGNKRGRPSAPSITQLPKLNVLGKRPEKKPKLAAEDSSQEKKPHTSSTSENAGNNSVPSSHFEPGKSESAPTDHQNMSAFQYDHGGGGSSGTGGSAQVSNLGYGQATAPPQSSFTNFS